MNQIKIGQYLKKLRSQRGLTQAELAELVGVSDRSVSRWENGVSLPDISIIAWLADYYDVDISDIIKGQNKEEIIMQDETKEAVENVIAYTDEEKKIMKQFFFILSLAGLFFMILSMTLDRVVEVKTPLVDFIIGFGHGFTLGFLFLGVLTSSGLFEKLSIWLQSLKQKNNK